MECENGGWQVVNDPRFKDGEIVGCNGGVSGMVYGKEALTFGLKMDINRVPCEDLTIIPGIGSELAERICKLRDERGRFRNVEELLDVKGIGVKKLEVIRRYVEIR